MESVWQWLGAHWKSYGVAGIVAGFAAVFTWLLGTRKALREARKEIADTKREASEKSVDSNVMAALEDRSQWTIRRPMTGSGDVAVRADELAALLSLDRDSINDALERLEARRRVVNIGGNLADPTPRWHTTRRL
jgi:hypothetical protein